MAAEEKELGQLTTTLRNVLVFSLREKYGEPYLTIKECYVDHVDGQLKPYGREISLRAAAIEDLSKKLAEVGEKLRESDAV